MCTINMPHGPANFRSTVVKPYYTEEAFYDDQPDDQADQSNDNTEPDDTEPTAEPTTENIEPTARNEQVQHHGRGRPPGSRNKIWPAITIRKGSRNRKRHIDKDFEEQFMTAISEGINTFITNLFQPYITCTLLE
jgi:hypothetical protein